ncbi:hypothetical protein [Nocardioides sp. CFH 31398]|uniref:hypothetical protein n=1 Tax=Nocardioides sp. CFH 31398 TaxID=2919579 RepID=UPI001F05CB73|nr:hypothetical protein [Nocardioides sp. CFH 31398]MCH1865223.1 hypothetical protein [Nocardioides sp. CFH 31398]
MSEQHLGPDERPTAAVSSGPSPYAQAPDAQPQLAPPRVAPGHAAVPPKHPSAGTSLALGFVAVLGGVVLLLPLLVAPWAWLTGARVVREIDASGGRLGGRSEAVAGQVLGIIGTVLLVPAVLLAAFYLYFFLALVGFVVALLTGSG